MNDHDEQSEAVLRHPGYAAGQLARAFTTAVTHEDADTRRRAEDRISRWSCVLDGMADGTLTIGSRTPAAGLPAWVTPEVVRGGFATGTASAGGPLRPYEVEAAREAGIPKSRRALFAYGLTEAGLSELTAMLDGGSYDIAVPEEAALLVVAWLVRSGDRLGALELLEVLQPFADRLRFAPRPTGLPVPTAQMAYRRTVGEAREAIADRRPNPAFEAMNEALTVWNPFADELLSHWLETLESGRVLARTPDRSWYVRGTALLKRYRQLAAAHTRCGKHRKPKENLAILRTALEKATARRPLSARHIGLLQHAVDSMVRRRGLPGSQQHAALRGRQADVAACPPLHTLAQLVVRRLSALPQQSGTPEVESLLRPVTEAEHELSGLPVGARIPEAIRGPVEGALSAPIGTLIERGVVPSAEVLAELVPQLVASTTALAYGDEALRSLMAAHYRAFRRRRSLLLLNLEHQVRLEELPWVQAVAGHRRGGDEARHSAGAALVQLGELALQGFPATILPNPLLREMGALAREAGVDVPLVEELAVDIFMGTFSRKFLAAAKIAGDLLRGTLYERYYGIDYRTIAAIDATTKTEQYGERPSQAFADLCHKRAAARRSWSPAVNGMVIEQAQILTSHNLATLVHKTGVAPAPGWADLACRCFTAVCGLTARVHHNPRPLNAIKDAAYGWRHMVFYLSLCRPTEAAAVVSWLEDETARQPGHVAARLAPAVAGLRLVADGGAFDDAGTAQDGRARRFLGWSTDGHWMRAEPTVRTARG
ncbi:hypothetical protein [Streptomyces sp. NPDC048650]|uniref:hypothetical protein n=1 Tax=Streptomyces sp. NPDC048650 TaxID=3365583 RepID=UPI0037163CC2